MKIIRYLQKRGYRAYLVGGCVRDLWLDYEPKDFDIATDAHAEELLRLFPRARLIGRRFPIVHVYVGGLEDLKRGIIRIIGMPERQFKQDPVRMLRVIRHAARTGFEMEKETWEALLRSKELIKGVARERLRDEILKDIAGFWLSRWFKILKESNLLYEIYPFYRELEENPDFSEEFLRNF